MKKYFIITLLFIFCITSNLHATVRTYGTVNWATLISQSANGDTIYIPGSGAVPGATCNKQLTFIGTGYNPDKQNPLRSTIAFIDLALGSAGCRFFGIYFTSSSTCSLTGNVNIVYENCQFNNSTLNYQGGITGLGFYNCIWTNSTASNNLSASNSTPVNVFFTRCIFDSPISSNPANTWSGSINNSLFLGSGSTAFITNASSLNVINCIYYGTIPLINGTNVSTIMAGNISFGASNNNFNATNNSGNFVNQNPLFVSYAPPGFSFNHDYHLQSGTPGGANCGLYGPLGGGTPFKMSGEPALVPVIRSMNLGTTTVVAGTPINVNVISTVKP